MNITCHICNHISMVDKNKPETFTKCQSCNADISKTDEIYKLQLESTDFVNIEPYLNGRTFIQHKCKLCDKIVKLQPKVALKTKIHKCNGRFERAKKLTNEMYLNILKDKCIKYKPLEEYKGNSIKIDHECYKCGHIWNVTPYHVLYGNNCNMCDSTRTKTNEEYLNEIKDLGLYSIEEYINSYTKIKHKCKTCDHIWNAKPGWILFNKTGCPSCSKSKGERIIKDYLINNKIEFIQEKIYDDLKYKGLLKFDFFIESKNLLIEYDGIQHFEPIEFFGGEESFKEQIAKDSLKAHYCNENSINLI